MDRRMLRSCVAVVLGLSATAMAVTFTWIGPADTWTPWQDSLNWTSLFPGYPDGPLDDAVIHGHNGPNEDNQSYKITLNADETVGSVTLSGDTDGDFGIWFLPSSGTKTLTTRSIFIDATNDTMFVYCKNGAILKNN